jgi:hypothetical protein
MQAPQEAFSQVVVSVAIAFSDAINMNIHVRSEKDQEISYQ